MAIDKVFAGPTKDYLPCDGDLSVLFKSDRRFDRVAVVEDNGYTGFCHTGLPALVNEILEFQEKVRASLLEVYVYGVRIARHPPVNSPPSLCSYW